MKHLNNYIIVDPNGIASPVRTAQEVVDEALSIDSTTMRTIEEDPKMPERAIELLRRYGRRVWQEVEQGSISDDPDDLVRELSHLAARTA